MDIYEKRRKIVSISIILVFITSLLTFRYVENNSWLDSFYFLIVTVSTVGFGDIQPKHNLTKFILILLITTGISSIAIASESIINRIVSKSVRNLYLNEPLDIQDHVIIVGQGQVADRTALLLRQRDFEVIILAKLESVVVEKRNIGFKAYLLIKDQSNLPARLNLSKARALYIFLEDDNQTIQLSIIAREVSESLLIYAHSSTKLTIELGEIIGITRTYQIERLLGSSLTFFSKQMELVLPPDQEIGSSKINIIMVLPSFLKELQHHELVILGYVNFDENNVYTFSKEDSPESISDDSYILTATTEPLDHFRLHRSNMPTLKFRKIWMCGISESNQEIIKYMGYDNKLITILSFNRNLVVQAIEDGFSAKYVIRDNLLDFVTEEMDDSDLILNLFDEITDALHLNLTIRKSGLKTNIVQSTAFPNEEKIFRKSGANRIIDPNTFMARGMLLILLKELKLSMSFVTGNSHLFEYIIDTANKIKSPEELLNEGMIILAIYKSSAGVIQQFTNQNIELGDSLVLMSNYLDIN
ncbi:MAG: NAD-binding protein [Candidatus Heimdallarchaeota archaeon]|nr:NAD-binding protein [Candidatus Heimdallarchaeota archaeon]